MARGSENFYGSMGSVPNQQPVDGSGARPLSVQASPQDFGAQVGEGIQKVGAEGENLAKQYGDIVNETLMTKADVGFATKLGQIKADFTSKSGMDAFNSYPQYQADVAQAFQDSRAGLPLGAQHGFDMLGARTMANHIADGSSFATSQLKEANRASGSDLTNANIKAMLDPDTAANPERVGYHQQTAIHGLQMQLDENHPGLQTNPDTGEVNFNETTPEGQGLKAQYEAQKDDIITRIQSNRFDTLSKNDALGAYGMYLNERPSFPQQTQATLDAKFEPIVFNAHKDNAVGHAVAQSQDDYSKIFYNPQSLAARNNNPGNLRDTETGQFKVFNTPEEGAAAMQSDLTAKVSGNSPAMEKNFGKGYTPTLSNIINTYAPANENNTAAYINTVSKETGFAPDQALTVADIPKLQAAMTKVEAGGSSSGTPTPQKSYATNPDGSMMMPADYYREHGSDVLANGDAYAEQHMPGDLAFKRAVRETLGNYMAKVKADQAGQYMMDNKNVMRGLTGELTKGTPPQTEAELRAIPGMNDLLNRVAAQDPKFAETIPRKIAEIQKQNTTTNSANGFETVTRTLQPQDEDHPNHIKNQTQLDSLLGKSDGTGINMKDYNDAKPATELPSETKGALLTKMQQIANANGNIDGKGQIRAMQWYSQAMSVIKKNDLKGDGKETDLDKLFPPLPMPSRMGQLSDMVKARANQKMAPTITSPDDPEFAKLPAGSQFVDADGKMWTKK